MPRILFLNRSYFPDSEATGQLLTELCEDLSSEFEVTVITGQPNTNASQVSFRRYGTERIHNVTVHRVWHTRFPKSSKWGRACNLVTFTLFATIAAWFQRRPDVVVTETDPPLLCLVGRLLRWRFGCRFVAYLQDIHPELGVALGRMRETPITKGLRRLFHGAYRSADRVVVLSRDMQRYLLRIGVAASRVVTIPNWVDTDQIHPVKSANRLRERWCGPGDFLVMYSGNLGVCQDLGTILDAAERLRDQKHVRFVLIGNGVSKQRLQDDVAKRQLRNVQFADYQPLSRLAESLSAADLHLVPVERRAFHYLMPSKLYGILASGTPLIGMAPGHSELAELVEREQVGCSIRAGDPESLAERILWFAQWCPDLPAYGLRARNLALTHYSRPHSTSAFATLLRNLTEGPNTGSRLPVAGSRLNEPTKTENAPLPEPATT